MKQKLTNNLWLKIAAVFFAVLLWMIVVNIDDPVDSATFRGIPVTATNEEVITNTGKTYQIEEETQTVTVVVYAKRSVLSEITAQDIEAVADMRELELKSLVPVTVTVRGFETRIESAEAIPRNIQVNIEDQTRNTFPLTVSTTGTLRDGYVLGEVTTNPETITIRGAESLVGRIDKAVARVDISGLGEDTELAAELLLYDRENNVIDQTLLTNNLGEQGVTVMVQVLSTKSLPLTFEVSGAPAEGYVYTGYTSEPEQVEVYGTAEALAELESISIPGTELNIQGATEKQEFVVDISPYLPEGIGLTDQNANNVIVTVSIERSGEKTIEFPVESIIVNNLSDDLRISYVDVEDLTLQFSGTQEALDALDIRSAVSIDMKNYSSAGTYDVPVTVEVPDTVTLTAQPVVKVELAKKSKSEAAQETQETESDEN